MADMVLIAAVHDARRVIGGAAIRTPLVRLNRLPIDAAALNQSAIENQPSSITEIFLKLENLQPIGSFKIRGAANAIARLPKEKLQLGVMTASAGNMAQGVAWNAHKLGIPCTVITPDTAPETKLRAIERLGGKIVKAPFDEWWRAFEERAIPGVEGTFVHAFDDPDVMAGNGTIALEILEDLPDVDAVVIPWGGGGLACGIASVLRQLRPECRVFAAEVETGAPLAASWASGTPTPVKYESSFVDGIGSKTVFPQMFARATRLLDGSLVTDLRSVANAVKLLVERNHIIAEGAGATGVACALAGKAGPGKVVCIVSGGNIDSKKLVSILRGEF